jgi:TonB family protein
MTSIAPNGALPRGLINGWSLFVCITFSLFFASTALADDSPQAGALEIAKAVSKVPTKTVLVLDFGGPTDATILGEKLADQFSDLIAGSGVQGIQVADRTQILQVAHGMGLERQFAFRDILGEAFAERLEAGSYVTGKIAGLDGNDNITVKLQLYLTSQDAPIKSLNVSFPSDADTAGLLSAPVRDLSPSDVPVGGASGYSMPRCESCPQGTFTKAAVDHKAQGIAVVSMIVGLDGVPTDLRLLKSLPYGLGEAALATVQRWRFVPATGPDGNPAAVRAIVEVSFRLY